MKTTVETTVTVWEYDKDGKIIKESKTISTQEKD